MMKDLCDLSNTQCTTEGTTYVCMHIMESVVSQLQVHLLLNSPRNNHGAFANPWKSRDGDNTIHSDAVSGIMLPTGMRNRYSVTRAGYCYGNRLYCLLPFVLLLLPPSPSLSPLLYFLKFTTVFSFRRLIY